MNTKLFAALLILGVATCLPLTAFAATCTADPLPDTTSPWCLTNANQGQFSPGQLTVTVTLSGNTLTVQASGEAGFSNLVIDKVAFNNENGNLFVGGTFSGNASNWSADGTPDHDGFNDSSLGTFNSGASCSGNAATCNPGGSGTDSGSLSFGLNGAPVWGSAGAIFVVHVRYTLNGQTCSAYISNAATPSGAPNGPCGGTDVPEPGSLALLGTGLFAAVGVLRRRLNLPV